MSARKWETVSVFISSTFQDMHAERDYLVKEVFPELLSWCEQRRLHLYDIDLRWGITAEDAENHNTVAACLHNIDKCRPFFLCFLGQRRGWVPGDGDVSGATLEEYPSLSGCIGRRSVTELEIEHALLSPMNRMYDNALRDQAPCRRALFFFRDDSYLKDVPTQLSDVYCDGSSEEVDKYKAAIVGGGYKVTEYDCDFDASAGRPDDFRVGGRELRDVVLELLKEQISKEFPDHVPSDDGDELISVQEEFIFHSESSYYPQKADMDSLCAYLLSDERITYMITGKGGSGKTSLMCAAVRDFSLKQRLIVRFCGIAPGTGTLYELFSGILVECGLTVPPTADDLFADFGDRLAEIASVETVLLIDGLNQCRDGMRLIQMLPRELPEGLKIVISCKSETLDSDTLAGIEAYKNIKLKPLETSCTCEFKRGMIERFLSLYLKKLDEDTISLITDSDSINTPLFVSVILSELRVFGKFDALREKISRLNISVEDTFGEVLSRLEDESLKIGDTSLCAALFGFLACSRRGLDEDEIIDAIRRMCGSPSADIRSDLRILLRQVRPFLSRTDKLFDFFHESFRIAAEKRYSGDMPRLHRTLADSFLESADPYCDGSFMCIDPRPFTEFPYHLRDSGNTEELRSVLLSAQFLRRKLAVCGIQSVIDDFDLTDDEECLIVSGALRLSAAQLSEDPSQLYSQLSGRLFGYTSGRPGISGLINGLENDVFCLGPCNNVLATPDENGYIICHGDYAVTALCGHMGFLAVSDEVNRIGIYDLGTGLRKNLINADGAVIKCFASDGRILYAGCADGTVTLWQIQIGLLIDTLRPVEHAVNALKIVGEKMYIADESGAVTVFDMGNKSVIGSFSTGKYPLTCVDSDGSRIAAGGLDQKALLISDGRIKAYKAPAGYVGRVILDGDALIYSTFYPRIYLRNISDGSLSYYDYTDGFDFAVPDSQVMNMWRNNGPYIRDMLSAGGMIAVATPYSAALISREDFPALAVSYPCPDARALAFCSGRLFAGNGEGCVFCYNADDGTGDSSALSSEPIRDIAVGDNTIAVVKGGSFTIYRKDLTDGRFDIKPVLVNEAPDMPGYFCTAASWKGGYGVGTFCQVLDWNPEDGGERVRLYQSQLLMTGINTTESNEKSVRMAAVNNALLSVEASGKLDYIYHGGAVEKITSLKGVYDLKSINAGFNVDMLVALNDECVAFTGQNTDKIFTAFCGIGGLSVMDSFPLRQRVRLMEASDDGRLIFCGVGGTVMCLDPFTGEICYEYSAPDEVTAMASYDGRLYLALRGGSLITVDESSFDIISVNKADSELTVIRIDSGVVYAGTDRGRLMVYSEKNTERVKKKEYVRRVVQPKKSSANEKRKPEKVIRLVPKYKEPKNADTLRMIVPLVPVAVTYIAILIQGGFKGWVNAVFFTLEPNSFPSWLIFVFGTVSVLFFLIMNSLAFFSVSDIYYSESRQWDKIKTLPLLDNIFLPLLFLSFIAPCLLMVHLSGGFNAFAALTATVGPLLVEVVYFQIIDLMQGGFTLRMARDKSFISMERAFRILRVTAVIIFFVIVIAATVDLIIFGDSLAEEMPDTLLTMKK